MALLPIVDVAASLGLDSSALELYGAYKAKVSLDLLAKVAARPPGRYVCVTSMSPTPAGEGKTTVAIGLAQALARLGSRSLVTLRQASLGPLFGVKGGASGGGRSQVLPTEDANLGLTGDIHAVEQAHNLLAAFVENHLYRGNRLQLDPRSITWRRAMDIEDRALRSIVTGLGGGENGVPRETGFDITAASEVMAVLSLSTSLADLRERLGRIAVGTAEDGHLVTAEELHCAGAMAALLRAALQPNLMQTSEGTPALVHGAAFANLSIGNSSVIADQMGVHLADYLITECGFGSDLGFEKFCDIKCRVSGLQPACAVVVVTTRALKHHSGRRASGAQQDWDERELLRLGAGNLAKHLENVRRSGLPAVVALNRFAADSDYELSLARELAMEAGAFAAEIADPWGRGSEGTEALAEAVVRACAEPASFRPLYDLSLPLAEKIEVVAREVYGAGGIALAPAARRSLAQLEDLGYNHLPVCVAKTHLSLSHDATLQGRPEGFIVPVSRVRLAAGAGFVVVECGDVRGMPGLPASPAGERIDLDSEGRVTGLQ